MSAAKTTAIDDKQKHTRHACARLSLQASREVGLANRVSIDSDWHVPAFNAVFDSLRGGKAIAETHRVVEKTRVSK